MKLPSLIAFVCSAALGCVHAPPAPPVQIGSPEPEPSHQPPAPAQDPFSAHAARLSAYPGSSSEKELQVACESIVAEKAYGSPAVSKALWDLFQRLSASTVSDRDTPVALRRALIAARSPAWGPGLLKILQSPPSADDEKTRDDHEYRQSVAGEMIGQLHYTDAIGPLVGLLQSPGEVALREPIFIALTLMAKEAEPVLIAALQGKGPAPAAPGMSPQDAMIPLALALGELSRPAGNEAILDAIPRAQSDGTKTALCWALLQFPTNPRSVKAFQQLYRSIPPAAEVQFLGGGSVVGPRSLLAQVASSLSDTAVVDWLISNEVTPKKPGLAHLMAAVELMPEDRIDAVRKAVDKVLKQQPLFTDMMAPTLDFGIRLVKACKQDPVCYANRIEDQGSEVGNNKASRMTVLYATGQKAASVRSLLLERLRGMKNAKARKAVGMAVFELTPEGDVGVAEALERSIGMAPPEEPMQRHTDDFLFRTALRLRARAMR